MKKIFIFILALIMALSVFTACESGGKPPANHGDATPEPTEEALTPTEAPTAEPTVPASEPPEDKLELIALRSRSIVANEAVGTVYIAPDGRMFAISGENKDGIFGGAECEPYDLQHDDSFSTPFDDYTIWCIKPGSTPALLDTDVKMACMLFYSRYENKYAGEYGESLIYLKNDGTVWLRGSNPKGIFGEFDKAEEPIMLMDGAANIGADSFSVAVGTIDGRILAWDLRQENGGEPMLIAEHADTSCLAGSTMYLTEDGELFARDAWVYGQDDEFASYGKGVVRFGRCLSTSFWALDEDGVLRLWRHIDSPELTELVLEERVVYACSSETGEGVCCINADGRFKYFSCGEKKAEMSNAEYGGTEYSSCWAITAEDMLFVNSGRGLQPIAGEVAYAVPGVVPGTVLYATVDGRLFSLGYCTPETCPMDEPFEIVLPAA